MKLFLTRWLALLCAGLLTACGPTRPAVEQESRRWQQQYETEQGLRRQAETQSVQQQQARSRWQSIATVLAIAAVVLLIVGTILGSAARHESEQT